MKKRFVIKAAIAAIALAGAVGLGTAKSDVEAKGTGIKYVYKNGTLTIKGKGEIEENKKLKKYRKKTKKIIIKNGITAIKYEAFQEFSKTKELDIAKSVRKIAYGAFPYSSLKKVRMPGNFKFYGSKEDECTFSNFNGPYTKVKYVFNTDINLDSMKHLFGNSFVAKKGDKKYITKAGAIYTKDKKTLVKIPFNIEKYKVPEGTENIDMQAFFYGRHTMKLHLDLPSSLKKIKRYVPHTITDTESQPYKSMGEYISVSFNKINLENDSLSLLYGLLINERNNIIRMYKNEGVVVYKGDFVLSKDGKYVITYKGNDKTVNVPDGVETIGYYSMHGIDSDTTLSEVRKVVLPQTVRRLKDGAFTLLSKLEEVNIDNVTELGDYSLAYTNLYYGNIPKTVNTMGDGVFYASKVVEASIPSGMKKIPYLTYGNCGNLRKVDIPDSITVIEDDAFMACDHVDVENKFFKNVVRVGKGAFNYCDYNSLVIPENVKYIGEEAFSSCKDNRHVTIKGSTKNYNMTAFSYRGDNPTFQFDKITEMKTGLIRKDDSAFVDTTIAWLKLKQADGYKVCISNNEKFKKNKKKGMFRITKITNKLSIKRTGKIKNRYIYVKITPYKLSGKKKIYGRVSVVEKI